MMIGHGCLAYSKLNLSRIVNTYKKVRTLRQNSDYVQFKRNQQVYKSNSRS